MELEPPEPPDGGEPVPQPSSEPTDVAEAFGDSTTMPTRPHRTSTDSAYTFSEAAEEAHGTATSEATRTLHTASVARAQCSHCGGRPTGMKADGSILGTPCKACCKVNVKNGHLGIAGSTEMPTVLEFPGMDERLFVWRYKNAWCLKKSKPLPPPDQATAPKLLGNAKIPTWNMTGEWTEPELQEWRGIASFYADACLKAPQVRSRACAPAQGKVAPPTFVEKTAEMARKMQEPQSPVGWRPAGIDAAWGDSQPAWGSWAPAWGKKPLTHSVSLPALRRGSPGKRKKLLVTTKEIGTKTAADSEKPDKEFRFVAHAMSSPVLRPEAPPSLECTLKNRKHNSGWKNRKADLPQAISDLIGYGDILFEPPSPGDDLSTMASTMSAPTLSWEDSRSALRDDSMSFLQEMSVDTVQLPDISPKAKAAKAPAASAPAQNETRAAAEKRVNRELVQASWKLQHQLSPVKVSIGHMFS